MKPTRGKIMSAVGTPSSYRSGGMGGTGGGLYLRTPGSNPSWRDPPSSSNSNGSKDGSKEATHKDPVNVYCRLRPNNNPEEAPCITVIDGFKIRLSPPEYSRAFNNGKEHEYSFAAVFPENSGQKGVFNEVGLPLVEDLVSGKNGLLFTYGVTGSGKTHTMQGSIHDGGIMYRAIDVLFNSIHESQLARKYTFKPDKLNGFEIRSSSDAVQEAQMEMIANMRKRKIISHKKNTSDPDLINRSSDETRIYVSDTNGFVYSIFISYCEFYNNYVYDLLDEDCQDTITGRPKFTSKNLREDSYQNIYVYGATEVEVRSPTEALEVFYRGQKRRRVEQTALNHESSRSHSVFNIRLIKAQIDQYNEVRMDVPYDVSQLALCDLAGSERTSRTGNTGDRLREAGNINSSLMTLRKCIEILRDNQNSGQRKPVPYRNAKITHLFRKYFEGTGRVRMIVCVNPRAADYDENLNVMQFSEMTQEIQIERVMENIIARKLFVQTPGMKRGDEVYKEALRKADTKLIETPNLSQELHSPIYNLGPEWPDFELRQFDDDEVLNRVRQYLEKRVATRNTLVDDHGSRQEEFRKRLVEFDQEMILLKEENSEYRINSENDKRRIRELESRLINAEAANSSLQRRVGAYSETKNLLENELDEKEHKINEQKKDVKRVARKYKEKIHIKDAINEELKNKLRETAAAKSERLKELAKLRKVKDIINDKVPLNGTISDPDLRQVERQTRRTPGNIIDQENEFLNSPLIRRQNSEGHNTRHRRSRSIGGPVTAPKDIWVDHQQITDIPLDTVLQPVMNKRKSITKLTEKDIINDRASRYALTTHENNSEGEIETKIYKGDIIPTTGGGRQIIFNDVEVLTHQSPVKESPPKLRRSTRNSKRSFEEIRGVGSRIAEMEERTKRNRI